VTTGNSVFIVQVFVTSCSFYIKYSICPPCCWTTHSFYKMCFHRSLFYFQLLLFRHRHFTR